MENDQAAANIRARVTFDGRKFRAYLEVFSPQEQETPCSYEEVQDVLAANNVVYGIDEKMIQTALLPRNADKRFQIAQGDAPQDGEDGKIVFHVDLSNKKIQQLTQDESGNVNYRDLGLIHNVKTGDILAERIPPTNGKPGMDVTGKVLMQKRGKNVPLPRGKNTVADDYEQYLYAAIDGQAVYSNKKLSVEPVLVLAESVSYATGDIDFIGNVVINGNVNPGFKVIAGGDIEIKGNIENADVIAQGSISIAGGITSGLRRIVKAGKDINVRFIENSKVEAGGSVKVREAIMQSFVKAGDSIRLTEKKAVIVGGVVQAGNLVECKVLGSQLASETSVEVGVNPHYRDEYRRLSKLNEDKNKQADNLNQNLTLLQKGIKSPETIDDKKRLLLIKSLQELKAITKEIAEIREKLAFYEQKFADIGNAKVRVNEIALPGVRIAIGNANYIVNNAIKYSEFVLDEMGDIRLGPLR